MPFDDPPIGGTRLLPKRRLGPDCRAKLAASLSTDASSMLAGPAVARTIMVVAPPIAETTPRPEGPPERRQVP